MAALRHRFRAPALLSLAVLLAVAGTSLVLAQEAAQTKSEKVKPRAPLPAYYSRVVTDDQREKLYGIQEKYAAEIEALEKQLAALKQKRAAEMESVLTEAQRTVVAQLRAEAQRRQQQRSAEGEAAGDDAADRGN